MERLEITLNHFNEFLEQHCPMRDPDRYAVVLWCAATHFQPAMKSGTLLEIYSTEKTVGRTRLMEVLERVCHNPKWIPADSSAAPTLLNPQTDNNTFLTDDYQYPAALRVRGSFAAVAHAGSPDRNPRSLNIEVQASSPTQDDRTIKGSRRQAKDKTLAAIHDKFAEIAQEWLGEGSEKLSTWGAVDKPYSIHEDHADAWLPLAYLAQHSVTWAKRAEGASHRGCL